MGDESKGEEEGQGSESEKTQLGVKSQQKEKLKEREEKEEAVHKSAMFNAFNKHVSGVIENMIFKFAKAFDYTDQEYLSMSKGIAFIPPRGKQALQLLHHGS